MRNFNLIGLFEAAKCFVRQEGSDKLFETSIRKAESEKQQIAPEEVTITSEETITEVFSTLVASHCLGKMVDVVIRKYEELGHQIV